MKICIYGAGAVGGHAAARLAVAAQSSGEHTVSVVARGAHLAAISERGLTLLSGGVEMTAKLAAATDDPSTLPPQDLLVVALKAHSTSAQAAAMARLLAPGGCAVFATNGIPWWWRHGLPGTPGPLPLVDPGGRLWNEFGPHKVLHCLSYSGNEVVRPGVVVHTILNDWVLGEPDGSQSERLARVAALFGAAGMKARAVSDIRREIWGKLLRNSSQSTVNTLVRLDTGSVSRDSDLRRLKESIIGETLAVAAACGWDLRKETDAAAMAAPTGGPTNRSSMLQDALAGRPLEVEALLGQVQAFARERSVATPVIDIITALLRGLNQSIVAPQGKNA